MVASFTAQIKRNHQSKYVYIFRVNFDRLFDSFVDNFVPLNICVEETRIIYTLLSLFPFICVDNFVPLNI